MNGIRIAVIALLIGLSAGVVIAQAGGGKSPQSVGPAASAPGIGIGPGGGRGAARWGADFTPGWSLMNQQERNEHRERMLSMKTYEECKAYQEQHHEQMAARAKERGGKAPVQPRRDACIGLKR